MSGSDIGMHLGRPSLEAMKQWYQSEFGTLPTAPALVVIIRDLVSPY